MVERLHLRLFGQAVLAEAERGLLISHDVVKPRCPQQSGQPNPWGDLESVYAFSARDSQRLAGVVLHHVVKPVDRPAEFPLLCRVGPEFEREDFHEAIVQGRRVVYRVVDASLQERRSAAPDGKRARTDRLSPRSCPPA